jgi:Xaa-Pro aminopeptidase
MNRFYLFLIGLLASSTLCAQGLQFPAGEYSARRDQLMKTCSDGIILIQGAATRTDYYPFVQNNNFMYLCGLEIPDAFLAMDPIEKETILFANVNEWSLRESGLSDQLIKAPLEFAGLTRIMAPGEMENWLRTKTRKTRAIYVCQLSEELARECSGEKQGVYERTISGSAWDGRFSRELQLASRLKSKFSYAEIRDCSAKIHEMRTIKTPAEIALMRQAGKIGVEAHKAVMKATRPGTKEYELAALFEYTCKKMGAQDLAYYTIICTAENHTDLHHHGYRRTLAEDDFLVLDAGPDLHYYDIDITTSFPASGKFTPRQKEIYEACNAVHEACMKVYRPGMTLAQCNKEAAEILVKQGIDTNSELLKSFGYGFGHYVGMAVHDVGGGPQILKPGMVFANEPLAVFAKEKLGVRIEDTILITETGCENLTAGIPRTVKEIEAFMKN